MGKSTTWIIALIITICVARAQTLPAVPGTPQRVIIDTDVGTDIDDSHAIAVALRLRQLGHLNILAFSVSTWQDKAAAFANLMLAHGGLTTVDIPIGAYQGASTSTFSCFNDGTDNYPGFVLAYFISNGITPNVPNVGRASFPDALPVLRKALATAPDSSVKIITLGGYTNIAALLQSPANSGGDGYASGQSLWNTKVIEMDSQLSGFPDVFPYTASPFVKSPPGYNAGCDLAASKYVFEHNGSVPIISAPLQVTMKTGGCYDGLGVGCTASLPVNSPVRQASDHFFTIGASYTKGKSTNVNTYGASSWDPATVIYTVAGLAAPPGGNGAYYTSSPIGSLTFSISPAQSTWDASINLGHSFVINAANWIGERDLLDTLFMADYAGSAPPPPASRGQATGKVVLKGAGSIQ